MRIAIRVDASAPIGSGHVMRCLTLGQALGARGAEVEFICRDLPGHLGVWIEEQGFRVHLLPPPPPAPGSPSEGPPHGSWLGVPLGLDAEQTRQVLERISEKPEWLVVDHYALDATWERKLKPLAKRIMVIDDLADRPHDCDLLLDQNYYRNPGSRYEGLLSPGCQRLLGPQFALLREEFRQLPALAQGTRGVRVLVFFGGTDATNETGKALSALKRLDLPGLEVEVVIGPSNSHAATIEARTAEFPKGVCHRQVTNMAELMARADLFIGAGGTTNWERCYFGLPSLVQTIALNQEETTRALAETGRVVYLGPAEHVTVEALYQAISVMLANPYLRKALSEASRELVDGKGALRVSRMMGALALELRSARMEDCERIFQWRNAAETRRYIFDPAPIPWEDHRRWFEKTLVDPNRILLLGEQTGTPIGVLRYDLSEAEATVSVYLDPARSGSGLGCALIATGSAWLREHQPAIKRVRAEVMEDNLPSHKAFHAAGYKGYYSVYVDDLE